MKRTNKLLSLLMSIIVMISATSFNASNVFAATIITSDYGYFNYLDEHTDYFYLAHKTKVNFNFTFDSTLDLTITRVYYDEYLDWEDEIDIIDETDIYSYSSTMTLEAGEYYISINNYFDDNCNYSYTIKDVSKYATGIKLKTSSKVLSVGKKLTLGYNLSPTGSIAKNTTWTSSNKNVATVDKYGVVTAKGLGKCTITVKLNNGKTSKCTIKVTSKDLYIFTNTSRSLPKINGKKAVTWKASNPSVASVSGQKVKGKSQATTVLKANYNGIEYKINIRSVSYDKLLKSTKSKLKDALNDPDSLKVYHIWRGYDNDGEPTVVLDYGAKNSYGAMVRGDYCMGYYTYNSKSKSFKNIIYYNDNIIPLTAKKKIF